MMHSNEIEMARDVKSGPSPSYRICFEDHNYNGNELISPCLCKGTNEFVHRQCLDRWRLIKRGLAFSYCTTWKVQFEFQVQTFEEDVLTRMKHRFHIAKKVLPDFLLVQFIIAIFCGYFHVFDYEGMLLNSITKHFNLITRNYYAFYYCMGSIVLFFFVGFSLTIPYLVNLFSNYRRIVANRNYFIGLCMLTWFPPSSVVISFIIFIILVGFGYTFFVAIMTIKRISRRHYDLITMQNLTKVYAVVDQKGNYNPPRLDIVHEERLRSLGLL